MGTYRAKPVLVEARQLVGTSAECFAIYQWVELHIGSVTPPCDDDTYLARPGVTIDPADGQMVIRTADGDMKAHVGDWIIKTAGGAFQPCKPDVFEAAFERVEDLLDVAIGRAMRNEPLVRGNATDPG